jgi:putative ABC transport system permease protein
MRMMLRRLWYALRRHRHDAELAEEMAIHREMAVDALTAQGVAPADAALDARRAFGSAALARNQSTDVWIWPWLQDLTQDVRFGARLLVKDRRLTFAAVSALALGLGATTTAFTFVNGAILRDLPLASPERLVWMRTVDARGRQLGVSYADVRDWRESARTLSHVIVSLEFAINVSEDNVPAQRYNGSYISHEAFSMVGRAPIIGRGFLPDDDRTGAPRVAIIAHTLWLNRYGGDASVLGRVVRVNDVPTTIVGVMPEGFHFPIASEVWVPVAHTAGPTNTMDARRGNRGVLVFAFGRLADGVPFAQAQAEMEAIAARLAREHRATNEGISVALEPLQDLYWGGEFGLRQLLLLVMGAVSVVLLIACVNVANLLLSRAVHRSREIAIRSSLGATRARIVRQLFVESALLAAVAGALGFVLSLYGVRIFSTTLAELWYVDGPAPFWLNFSVDRRVYGFLAAACLGSTMFFGLAPALHISRTSNAFLKDGGRGMTAGLRARRWTGALLVAQLALTMVLLAGAGLMLRSFVALYQAGRVLDTSNLISMQLALGAGKYPQAEQIKRFHEQLDERLAAIHGFSAVTVASDIPMMTVINALRQLAIDGRPTAPGENPPTVAYLYIGPRYFETLRLRLIRGRLFTADDGAPGREAAIVNQRFASMFFPDRDPIGQRIRLTNAAAPTAPQPWFTIVGVAPTVPQILFREDPEPVVYVARRGEPAPHRFVSIIARADGDRASIVSLMRDTVRKVDPDLPGYYVRTIDEVSGTARWRQRVFGVMLAALAGIALVLASVGLYAVTAHGISQRTQEIGIRVALGARASQVVWLFVQRTLLQVGVGLVLGLAAAIAAGRLLSQFLVRTAPTDPLALGVVSVLLIVVSTIASVWPARRAAHVDPTVALRCE